MGNQVCCQVSRHVDKEAHCEEKPELIVDVLTAIRKHPQTFGLLSADVLEEIEVFYSKNYCSLYQQKKLTKQLIDYMQECLNRILPETKKSRNYNFFGPFGERILKTQNQTFTDNKNLLKIMSYIAKNSAPNSCYLNLKFDLNIDETLSVAEKTRQLFKYDQRAFFFLSNYLYQSCLNLQNKHKSTKEIIFILATALKQIQEKYPLTLFQTPKEPAQKIEDGESNLKQRFTFETLDLSNVELGQRRTVIETFLLVKAKQANADSQKLEEFVEEWCKQKGRSYKIQVRLKDKEQAFIIDSLIEQFIKAEVSQQQKERLAQKLEEFTLKENIEKQIQFYQKQISETIQKIEAPLTFKISNLLKARILFPTYEDVKENARKLIQKLKAADINILKIDNKIGNKTSDIVFRILVGKTISQLHLSLDFNISNNDFIRKAYQISHSKISSSFSTLHKMNNQITNELFQQTSQCFKLLNSTSSHIEQRKRYESQQTFKSLLENYELLLRLIGFQPSPSRTTLDEELLRQKYKVIIDKSHGLILSEKEKELTCRNNGEFYRFTKKYDEAITEYEKYLIHVEKSHKGKKWTQKEKEKVYQWMGILKKDTNNLEEAVAYYLKSIEANTRENQKEEFNYSKTLKNLGNVYDSLGKYKEAIQYYTKSLELKEKLKGKESLECAPLLLCIACAHEKLGNLNQAIDFYKRLQKTHQNVKGKGAMECAPAFQSMGQIYQKQKKYAEALQCYSQAKFIYSKAHGSDSKKSKKIEAIIDSARKKM